MSLFLTTLELDQARKMYLQVIRDQLARSSGYSHPAFEAYASSLTGSEDQKRAKVRLALRDIPLSPSEALVGLAKQIWQEVRERIASSRGGEPNDSSLIDRVTDDVQQGIAAAGKKAQEFARRITVTREEEVAALRQGITTLQQVGEDLDAVAFTTSSIGMFLAAGGIIAALATAGAGAGLITFGAPMIAIGGKISIASLLAKTVALALEAGGKAFYRQEFGTFDKQFWQEAVGLGVDFAANKLGAKLGEAAKIKAIQRLWKSGTGLGMTALQAVQTAGFKPFDHRVIAAKGFKGLVEGSFDLSAQLEGKNLSATIVEKAGGLFEKVKGYANSVQETAAKGQAMFLKVVEFLAGLALDSPWVPGFVKSLIKGAIFFAEKAAGAFQSAGDWARGIASAIGGLLGDAAGEVFRGYIRSILIFTKSIRLALDEAGQLAAPIGPLIKRVLGWYDGYKKIRTAVFDGVVSAARWAQNKITDGYQAVKGFGVSVFEKAKSGLGLAKDIVIEKATQGIANGKNLFNSGVVAAREFGEELYNRATILTKEAMGRTKGAIRFAMGLPSKFLSFLTSKKEQAQEPVPEVSIGDGELVGLFEPNQKRWDPGAPDSQVNRDLSVIKSSRTQASLFDLATSGTLVLINGINTNPIGLARFVQASANRQNTPAIGLYNKTDGFAADLGQYSGDRMRLGKNSAFNALLEIIRQRKGKLHLAAHSQGTAILQRAYDVANREGSLGDPATIYRKYYGDAAGNPDPDNNLTIYSNINDYVSVFVGADGGISKLTDEFTNHPILGLIFSKENATEGSANVYRDFTFGDAHSAEYYARNDPTDIEGNELPNRRWSTFKADRLPPWLTGLLEVIKYPLAVGNLVTTYFSQFLQSCFSYLFERSKEGYLWTIRTAKGFIAKVKTQITHKAELIKNLSVAFGSILGAYLRHKIERAKAGVLSFLGGVAALGVRVWDGVKGVGKSIWSGAKSAVGFAGSMIKRGFDAGKQFAASASLLLARKAKALAEKAYQKAMAVKANIEKAHRLAQELKRKALNAAKFIANKAKEGVINTAVKAKDFVVGAAVSIGQTGKAAAAWAGDKIDEGLDAAKGAATFAAEAAKSAVSTVANSVAKGWNLLWGQRMEEGPGGLQESGEPSGPAASSLQGTSLAPGLIRAAGKAFGADLSGVRVHQGMEAAYALAGMGARAMASGGSVFFAPGEFNAGDSQGLHLIGHELAHVVQQGRGGLNPSQLTESGRAHFEREADDQAGELLTSLRRRGQHTIVRHAVSVQAADGASVSRSQVGYLEGLMEIVHSRVIAKLAGREDLPKESPSLSVRLECDLERMTAAEIVEAWASAILQEIESSASQAALPAKLSFPAMQKAEESEVHHLLPERGQKQTVPGTTKQEPAKSQEPAKPAAKRDALAGNVAQNDDRFQVEKGAFTMAREGVEYTKGYQSPAAQKSRVRYAQAVKALESASANLKAAEEKVAFLEQQASPYNKSKEAAKAKNSLKQAKLAYDRAEKALQKAEASKAKAEVNEKAQQGRTSRLFHWPGGTSGLTLGAGYDMKLRDTQQIVGHLSKAGVDYATAASVARMNVIFRNRSEIEGEGGKAMKEAALISLMNRSFSADPKEAEAAQGEILPLYKQALEIEAKAGAPNSNVKETKGSSYTLGKDKKRSTAETDEKIADLMAQFEQEMKDSGTNRALKSSPIFVTNTDPDLAGARPESPSDPMSAYSPGAMKPLPSAVGVYGPQPASKDSHLTHGILTPEEQKGLFETVYPEYEKEAKRRFGFTEEQWVGLPQDARDLLADMTYQGTPQKSAKNPDHKHIDFSAMKTAILSGDKAAMKAVLDKGYADDARMKGRKDLIDTMDLPGRKKESGDSKESNAGEANP